MRTRPAVLALEDRLAPAAAVPDLPEFPVIDGPMQWHLQNVAARGRALGNRADVFAKVGDSNTAYEAFLTPLGAAGYAPAAGGFADRPDLVAAWAAYAGTAADGAGTNSFTRDSLGDRAGWSSTLLRDNVALELSAVRPAVAVIMIGTNDVGNFNDLALFRDSLTLTVRACLDAGVIPVVSTLPDITLNAVWAARVPGYNQVIADVADAENVPLWNLWRQLAPLPDRGLSDDRIHLSVSPNGSGALAGADLAYGFNLRNRGTLEVLANVRAVVFANGPADGDVPPVATPWTPLKVGQRVLAVASGAGRGPDVAVYDADTRVLLNRFVPYEAAFRGGAAAAVGDVTGDGVPDIVVGPGPGGGPVVKVFSGADGREVRSWFAYEESFRGGVVPAVGDVDGDGAADVAVGSGPGGGPRVRVFSGRGGGVLADFFAYESTFRDGVNVAVFGSDIVTGSGVGGGPAVATFEALTGKKLSADFAFDPAFRGGVAVAAGDVTGDGVADVVAAPGAGGGEVVRVFDGAAGVWRSQVAVGTGASRTGLRIAVAAGRIAVGTGWLAGSAVRLVSDGGAADGDALTPFGDFRGGVFVG